MTNLGTEQLVYNGELEGVTKAIEYASEIARPGQLIQVYSDNQAITTQGEQGSRRGTKVWTSINCYNEENKL